VSVFVSPPHYEIAKGIGVTEEEIEVTEEVACEREEACTSAFSVVTG
jgi:hypothetical protein